MHGDAGRSALVLSNGSVLCGWNYSRDAVRRVYASQQKVRSVGNQTKVPKVRFCSKILFQFYQLRILCRYLNKAVWGEVFSKLLNIKDKNHLPDLRRMRNLINSETNDNELDRHIRTCSNLIRKR